MAGASLGDVQRPVTPSESRRDLGFRRVIDIATSSVKKVVGPADMTLDSLQARFRCVITIKDASDSARKCLEIVGKLERDVDGAVAAVQKLAGPVPLVAGVPMEQSVIDRLKAQQAAHAVAMDTERAAVSSATAGLLPLATYCDANAAAWAAEQRRAQPSGSVSSSDSDMDVSWGWSARVARWTQGNTRQWAMLSVGVPVVDANKISLDGAALLALPAHPTTELEEQLRKDGLAEDAVIAIAAAYGKQQWQITTEVVRKWSHGHVWHWAVGVLGFSETDAGVLTWDGAFLALADDDQVPDDLSEDAKAKLVAFLSREDKDWEAVAT